MCDGLRQYQYCSLEIQRNTIIMEGKEAGLPALSYKVCAKGCLPYIQTGQGSQAHHADGAPRHHAIQHLKWAYK